MSGLPYFRKLQVDFFDMHLILKPFQYLVSCMGTHTHPCAHCVKSVTPFLLTFFQVAPLGQTSGHLKYYMVTLIKIPTIYLFPHHFCRPALGRTTTFIGRPQCYFHFSKRLFSHPCTNCIPICLMKIFFVIVG